MNERIEIAANIGISDHSDLLQREYNDFPMYKMIKCGKKGKKSGKYSPFEKMTFHGIIRIFLCNHNGKEGLLRTLADIRNDPHRFSVIS